MAAPGTYVGPSGMLANQTSFASSNNARSGARRERQHSEQMVLTDAQRHFNEIGAYLDLNSLSSLAQLEGKNVSAQRQNARDKLTRLNAQQFQELSTDVYDEMSRRRNDDPKVPFLSVNALFHPKRNQARQKLATLPGSRFRELATDVFGEIGRRHGLSKVGRQATASTIEEEEDDGEEDLKTAVAAPTIELPPLGKYHPAKTPGNTATAGGQQQAPPLSAVNFAHLDSLMADLGSMFDQQPAGQQQGAKPSVESNSREMRPASKQQLQADPIAGRQHRLGSQDQGRPANNELAEAKQQLLLLKQKNQDLEEQVSIQVKTASAQDSTITTLQATVKRLQSDLTFAQSSLNEVPTLQANLSTSQVELQNAKDKMAQLQQRMQALTSENAEKERSQSASWQAKEADYQSTTASLTKEVETLKKDLDHANRQLDAKDMIIQELGQQLATMERDREATKTAAPPIVARKPSLQDALAREASSDPKRTSQNKVTAPGPPALMEEPKVATEGEAPPTIASVIADTIREYVDRDGNLPFSTILDFQHATEHLFLAGRSDDKSNVLEAMRKIVASTRNLSDLASVFEEDLAHYSAHHQHHPSSPHHTRFPTYLDAAPTTQDVQDLRERMGQYLQDLMEAAKAFAVALTASVAGKPGGKRRTVVEQRAEVKEEIDRLDDASFCLTDTVLDLVRLMGVDETTYVAPPTENRSNPHLGPRRPSEGYIEGMPETAEKEEEEDPIAAYSDLPQTERPLSLPDLRRFLEVQTDIIVKSIHQLMQVLRAPHLDAMALDDTVQTLADVVNRLDNVTSETIEKGWPDDLPVVAKRRRQQVEPILDSLLDARDKLLDSAEDVHQSTTGDDEAGKQNVVSAAYDVARMTKELVHLFDA